MQGFILLGEGGPGIFHSPWLSSPRGQCQLPVRSLLSSAPSCLSYFTGNSLFGVFRVSCPTRRESQEEVWAHRLHFPFGPWEHSPLHAGLSQVVGEGLCTVNLVTC